MKLLIATAPCFLVLGLGLTLMSGTPPQGKSKPTTVAPRRPVDVFAAWDGFWAGSFVGYDPAGVELYRIRVEQAYRIVDDNTQEVSIRDRMPDGKTITGRGTNVAKRRPDGSLDLLCTVKKSNGERVEHKGRLVRGPGGREELVWYSNATDRTETFREWVVGKGKNARYFIHGMGRYGKQLMLMAGEYQKKE